MKKMILLAAVTGIAATVLTPAFAQTNSASADSFDKGSEKRAKAAMDALNLSDPAKETKVHDIVYNYLIALKDWHATNDAQIKPLWDAFAKDRNTHDPAKVQEGID